MSMIIVDIDGTCSDPTHRLHHIKGEKKNWDAFHATVADDLPHEDIRLLVWALSRHASIVYVSGRMERCRKDTENWIARHGFPYAPLHLRADGDHRQDYVIKGEIADRLGLCAANVWLAIDDRQQVVDMWRSRGIRCLQVAKGDY